MRKSARRYILAGIAMVVVGVVIAYCPSVPEPLESEERNENTQGCTRLEYIILAYNDLGMHCIQPDYSMFMILPPGNNLRVQVFGRGEESELVTEGIMVTYRVTSQEDPAAYTNFWEYSEDYGYPVPPGTGITGNTLQGTLELDGTGRYWVAEGIPVVGLPGGTGPTSPYQQATVTVYERSSGRQLAVLEDVVVPVSTEMDCANCHGQENTWANILKAHDEANGTDLLADALNGNPHRCNECHADPILGAPGRPGLPSLSLAMHGFHADKMGSGVDSASKETNQVNPVCYNCHPGEQTACNRGVMKAAGYDCDDCHGSMARVAESIVEGRTPWFQEPRCGDCHAPAFEQNAGLLYRDSYLLNGPDEEMDDIILCASCHNSPHAEWPSTLALDNAIPEKYQGEAGPIEDCNICHEKQSGITHQPR